MSLIGTLRRNAMSASLIGRLRSSAYWLSPLGCRCHSGRGARPALFANAAISRRSVTKALARYNHGPYNASEREQTRSMTCKAKAYLALVSAFAGFSILEWLGWFNGWKTWLGVAAGILLVLWTLNAVREHDGIHVHNDSDMGRS